MRRTRERTDMCKVDKNKFQAVESRVPNRFACVAVTIRRKEKLQTTVKRQSGKAAITMKDFHIYVCVCVCAT